MSTSRRMPQWETPVPFGASTTAALSFATCLVALSVWQQRVNGSVSVRVLLFLAVAVSLFAVYGLAIRQWTRSLVPAAGAAYELLLGFFGVSVALLILTLATPFGAAMRASIVCGIALTILPGVIARSRREDRSVDVERASLICIVVCVGAAALWTRDMQPLTEVQGTDVVFRGWFDTFIHAREISLFGASHGVSTLSDMRAAGAPAPIYHVAAYMLPAALNALTDATALDAFSGFELPFGIVLSGVAAFALANAVFGPRAALLAAIVVVMCPDPFQQGFGIQLLAYHFMSQVNLGTLYGIACICIGWLFVIEGCRRHRLLGVACGYLILCVCLTFKAHIFVANALPMMIYPCLFFRRVSARWRLMICIVFIVTYASAIVVAQRFERVPLIRLDGSGLFGYVSELLGATEAGARHDWFVRFIMIENHVFASWLAAAAMIGSATFGVWLLLWPVVTWRHRKRWPMETIVFPFMVVSNYFVMSLGLALDKRAIGAPEELLNRPFSWAYFVVVVWSVAGLHQWLTRSVVRWSRGEQVVTAAIVVGLFGTTYAKSRDLQTFPAWGENYDHYAAMNSVPECLFNAGQFIRANGGVEDIVQDEAGDAGYALTAISERQSFAGLGAFGGTLVDRDRRLSEIARLAKTSDASMILQYMRAHRIDWYLMHPMPGTSRTAPADAVAFVCSRYTLLHATN